MHYQSVILMLLFLGLCYANPFKTLSIKKFTTNNNNKQSSKVLEMRGGAAVGPINQENLYIINAVALSAFATEFLFFPEWTAKRYWNTTTELSTISKQSMELVGVALFVKVAATFAITNLESASATNVWNKVFTWLWSSASVLHLKWFVTDELTTSGKGPFGAGQLEGLVPSVALALLSGFISYVE